MKKPTLIAILALIASAALPYGLYMLYERHLSGDLRRLLIAATDSRHTLAEQQASLAPMRPLIRTEKDLEVFEKFERSLSLLQTAGQDEDLTSDHPSASLKPPDAGAADDCDSAVKLLLWLQARRKASGLSPAADAAAKLKRARADAKACHDRKAFASARNGTVPSDPRLEAMELQAEVRQALDPPEGEVALAAPAPMESTAAGSAAAARLPARPPVSRVKTPPLPVSPRAKVPYTGPDVRTAQTAVTPPAPQPKPAINAPTVMPPPPPAATGPASSAVKPPPVAATVLSHQPAPVASSNAARTTTPPAVHSPPVVPAPVIPQAQPSTPQKAVGIQPSAPPAHASPAEPGTVPHHSLQDAPRPTHATGAAGCPVFNSGSFDHMPAGWQFCGRGGDCLSPMETRRCFE